MHHDVVQRWRQQMGRGIADWANPPGMVHEVLGATTGLLGATPAGLPLYEASGWQHVEDWQIFTNAVSTQFSQ